MISRHLELELAAVWRGEVIEPRAAVPGCVCVRCTGLMAGATRDPDLGNVRCPLCQRYRESVRCGDRSWYQCQCGTRSALTWHRTELGEMWDTLPRALAPHARNITEPRQTLNIEAARSLSIRAVATSLGIQANRAGYARCPFHDDRKPSLHLNDRKGAAFCNPCGKSWDPIALVMAMRGIPFADAVKELAA